MKLSSFSILLCFISFLGFSQDDDKVYLFSYFMDNGQDGLHLAYSHDGLSWEALNDNKSFLTPTVGADKLMRDPCVIQGPDGKFHMVWTVSWGEKGIGYANSEDLIHWSEQKYIPVMEHEQEALNCWAPELFYDKKSGEYMIYWATTIPGRFKEGEGSGDEKYNHRMYYTTTKDFEHFSDTKLLYDQGFNVIDAVIKKTGKDYIMFLKDETRHPAQKNIRIAKSRSLTGGYSKPGEKISGDAWVEGPTVAKINGEWVVYFDVYTSHRMGAVRSKDLTNWTDISDRVNFPAGTRHGTVFIADKKILEGLIQSQKQ